MTPGIPTPTMLGAIVALAAGTFALRAAGPLLGARPGLAEGTRRLATTATVVLLTALVAVATLSGDGSPAGAARPAGVLMAGVLAWRRAPFVVVVVSAAVVTATLRLLGAS